MLERAAPGSARFRTESEDRRAAARLRQARCRARRRRGDLVYLVTVPDIVVEALIASTRLSEGGALDRAGVERAIGGVLRDWAGRWVGR